MNNICTFFGHRDCPHTLKPLLQQVLIYLIEQHTVTVFYVGRQGAFDAIACTVLQELTLKYPSISYAIVLEKPPGIAEHFNGIHTILPECVETAPPRYAISRRNDWMLRQADYVITYITHTWGGAAHFAQKARRQNKTVINLTDLPHPL